MNQKFALYPGRRGAATLLLLAAAWSLVLLAPPAQAHDIVLVPQAGGLTVRYGHPHDWQPVDPEKLLELQVLGPAGAVIDRHDALSRKGLDMLLAPAALAGPALVAARYDNGLWVELPAAADGKPQWRNTSRFMTPQARAVTLSVKFAKALAAGAADDTLFNRRVGHLLELVPQKNPLALKAGDMLPVLVLFDGQPLAGAAIENSNLVDKLAEDKIPRWRTDASGIAQVPLRGRGVNTLAVDLERVVDASLPGSERAAPANRLLIVATYTFVR
jgi:nickel transport protein